MTQPTQHETLLARRLRIDIDTATYPAVAWGQLLGIEELKPNDELRAESDEAYEDNGAYRDLVTGSKIAYEAKILHRKDAGGSALSAVQAFLEARYEASKTSTAAGEFGMRVYDRNGIGQARQGRAYVAKWTPDGGNPGSKDTISVTLQFQGPTTLVTNPVGVTTPEVTAVIPTGGGTAGGTPVLIKGSKFTGVTGAAGVKFGANNATSYQLVDDNTIVAVSPAGTAGAKDVTVTTPAGTSPTAGTGNDFTYA